MARSRSADEVVRDLSARRADYLIGGSVAADARGDRLYRLREHGAAAYSALNSVGLFSHDRVEDRHS